MRLPVRSAALRHARADSGRVRRMGTTPPAMYGLLGDRRPRRRHARRQAGCNARRPSRVSGAPAGLFRRHNRSKDVLILRSSLRLDGTEPRPASSGFGEARAWAPGFPGGSLGTRTVTMVSVVNC